MIQTGTTRRFIQSLLAASAVLLFTLTPIEAKILVQTKEVERPELAAIFEEYKVEGTFVLYDLRAREYTRYNPARARQRFLPLSTFKIPNALIGLETRLIPHENYTFKHLGEKYEVEAWNKDLTLREALSVSCVPCFQQIARRTGGPQMKKFLKLFKYGNCDISGGIDRFWLDGGLRISADEEVEFLRKFYRGKLPVSAHSIEILKRLLVFDKQPSYTLSGKTGLQLGLTAEGIPRPSIPLSSKLAWFVGYLEQKGNVYFFALNIEGTKSLTSLSTARVEIMRKILKRLGLL